MSASPRQPPLAPPEMVRRRASPLAMVVATLCEEVLRELRQSAHSAGASAARDDADALGRRLNLSEWGRSLAQALEGGELDDPFVGLERVQEAARHLGPKYVALLDALLSGPEGRHANHVSLPPLRLHRELVDAVLDAEASALALGAIEEGDVRGGMFALLLDGPLPLSTSGFRLGIGMASINGALVLHQVFEFYGFARYECVLRPTAPIVRQCLGRMLDASAMHILTFNPQGAVSVFKSEGEEFENLGLRHLWPAIAEAETSARDYERAAEAFARTTLKSTVLNWIARDARQRFDLSTDFVSLRPQQR